MPGQARARRASQTASLLDLAPTLTELSGGQCETSLSARWPGRSLVPHLHRGADSGERDVISEYLADGAPGPCRMLRRGRYKYVYTWSHPDLLYDLESDPHELEDLSQEAGHAERLNELRMAALADWDPAGLRERILADQQQRRLIQSASLPGSAPAWDYQPFIDDTKRFVRSRSEHKPVRPAGVGHATKPDRGHVPGTAGRRGDLGADSMGVE